MATLSCKPAGTKGRPWFLALLFALVAVGANAQIDTTPYRLDASPGIQIKRTFSPERNMGRTFVTIATNQFGIPVIARTWVDSANPYGIGYLRVGSDGSIYYVGTRSTVPGNPRYSFSAKGLPFLPASVTIGATYTSEADFRGINSDGTSSYATQTRSQRVVGFETVTVPAGTFTALKLEDSGNEDYHDGKGFADPQTDTYWLAPGVGLVKQVTLYEGATRAENLEHYVILNAQPQAQTVAAGARATLSVTATGGGSSLTYQWRKDGVNVSGANASSYTLPSAQASHAGSYTVVVRNTAGSVTSSAATLTVKAPVTGVMTVRTIGDVGFDYGQGTVNPNYNGQLLEIGRHYTMTAVARPGSAFVNWTDGLDNVLTNAPTVKFEMVSNLVYQANFRDVTKPTFTVAAPTLNQRVSNAVFTATGTARDNVRVTAVNYQLNGGAWTAAGSTNSGTNWTAGLTLTPGPNTLRVFAQDAAGNRSLTNSVSFTYVVSGLMTVRTNGQGTVNPNYNGQLLEIGRHYTMTAVARPGSGFVNWTDGLDNVLTNAPTVKFEMVSNLVYQANFRDVTKPTLTVAAPTLNQRVSNAVFTATGTARDNVGVTAVNYQLNDGAWSSASGTANWTAQLVLDPGPNTLRAFVQDAAGNRSLTNSVTFTYVRSDRPTVTISGTGTVTPNYHGQLLELGKSQTMTATASNKATLFDRWTDGDGNAVTNGRTVRFTMASNLVLQANFVPNPYLEAKGEYHGLFYPTNGTDVVASNTAGFLSLLVSDQGGFSGQAKVEGATVALSGTLTPQGRATVTVARAGKSPLVVVLALDAVNPANPVLGGTVQGQPLQGYRVVTSASAYAGKHVLLVRAATAMNGPAGAGPGAVTVTTLGAVTVSGTLADGAPMSQSGKLVAGGQWPFYMSLYAGRGVALGWLTVGTNGALATGGEVFWTKPALGTERYFPMGFTETWSAALERYTPPAAGANATEWRDGALYLSGGNLPEPVMALIQVSNNVVRVTGGAVSNLLVKISPADGQFSGSFRPSGGPLTSFKGALVPVTQSGTNSTFGGGWFLGTNTGGKVLLMENEPLPFLPLPPLPPLP